MELWTYIKEAINNLFTNKLRTCLALLGILVGTASVVAMVSGGELATNEALKQFKLLGTDLLSLSLNDVPTNEGSPRNEGALLLKDVNTIPSRDNRILDIAPYTQLYNTVRFNGHTLNATILGVTDSFANIVHLDMTAGRNISILDQHALFCVLGNDLYQQIKHITFADPLGQQIRIGNTFFTIIGIAKPWPENSFVYANIDSGIMIPILSSQTLSQFANINNIIMRLKPNADIDHVSQNITAFVKQLAPNKRLFFRSAKELINSMAKQSKILTLFLGLIGGISLLVGGIGVMNIMLVSVVERKSEIGIRLAVGARERDICLLFLTEAVILAMVGGLLGVLTGMLIAYVIAIFWHWEFSVFLLPPLIGFSVSTAIGIFFGFYPALQAAKLDPIVALRSD